MGKFFEVVMPAPKDLQIPAVAQTLCADILDNLRMEPQNLPKGGTFFVKKIGEYSYVYHRIVYSGMEKDTVVGVETEELADLVKQVSARRKHVSLLASSASAAKATECDRKSWIILKRLYEAGFFDSGGVVVGTNAFLAMQNRLGVRWPEEPAGFSVCQTMDIDVTWPNQHKVVVAGSLSKDFNMLLKDLELVPQFSTAAKNGTSVYTDSSGYSFEILTPEVGKPGEKIVPIPQIGAHAQKLRFLDYLIKDPVDTIVLRGASAIKIMVPSPERFAVHKIALSDMRSNPHKKQKDIDQASVLLSVLISSEPEDLAVVFKEFQNRGPSWKKHLLAGFVKLPQHIQSDLRAITGLGNLSIQNKPRTER